MSRQITLNKGMFAVVDDDLYDFVNQWKWYYKEGYAVRTDRNKETIPMHRVIADTPLGLECDHIDRDKLNNQRSNLRNCTHAQNQMNTYSTRNTSGYKGVHFRKDIKKWCARIKLNGVKKHLGVFEDIKEAAKAYDAAAVEYFGEFATPSDPRTPAQRDLDTWQADASATRKSDHPY